MRLRTGLRGLGGLLVLCIVFSSVSAIRILPLGDSITAGDPWNGSYRCPLWRSLRAAGIPVDFVGTLNDTVGVSPYPHEQDCDHDHEGHWGWTTGEVLSQLPEWLTHYTPDVALVHLGTNDYGRDDAIAALEGIIDVLRSANPMVAVLIARIIPMAWGDSDTVFTGFNTLVDEIPERKSTAVSPVIVVDHHSGFNPRTDTYDGVHTSAQGSEKMAQRWYEALVPLLKPSTPRLRLIPDGGTMMMQASGPYYDCAGRKMTPGLRPRVMISRGKPVPVVPFR